MDPDPENRKREAGLSPEQRSKPSLMLSRVYSLVGAFVTTVDGEDGLACVDPTVRSQAAAAARKICGELSTLLEAFDERPEEKQIGSNDHPRDTLESKEIEEKKDMTNTSPSSIVTPQHSSVEAPSSSRKSESIDNSLPEDDKPLPAFPPSHNSSIAAENKLSLRDTPESKEIKEKNDKPKTIILSRTVSLLGSTMPPTSPSSIVTPQLSSAEAPTSPMPPTSPSSNSSIVTLQHSSVEPLSAFPSSPKSSIVPENKLSIVTPQHSSDEAPPSSRKTESTDNFLPVINMPLPDFSRSLNEYHEKAMAILRPESRLNPIPPSSPSYPSIFSFTSQQPSSVEAPSSSHKSESIDNSLPEDDKPLSLFTHSLESSIVSGDKSPIVTPKQHSSVEAPSSSRESESPYNISSKFNTAILRSPAKCPRKSSKITETRTHRKKQSEFTQEDAKPLLESAPPPLESSIVLPGNESAFVTPQQSPLKPPSSSLKSESTENLLPEDDKPLKSSARLRRSATAAGNKASIVTPQQHSSDEAPSSSRKSETTGKLLPEDDKPLRARRSAIVAGKKLSLMAAQSSRKKPLRADYLVLPRSESAIRGLRDLPETLFSLPLAWRTQHTRSGQTPKATPKGGVQKRKLSGLSPARAPRKSQRGKKEEDDEEREEEEKEGEEEETEGEEEVNDKTVEASLALAFSLFAKPSKGAKKSADKKSAKPAKAKESAKAAKGGKRKRKSSADSSRGLRKSSRLRGEEEDEEEEETEDEEEEEEEGELEERPLPQDVQELLMQLVEQQLPAGVPIDELNGEPMEEEEEEEAEEGEEEEEVEKGDNEPEKAPVADPADGWTYARAEPDPEPIMEQRPIRRRVDYGRHKNELLHIFGCRVREHNKLTIDTELRAEMFANGMASIARMWRALPRPRKQSVYKHWRHVQLSCAPCAQGVLGDLWLDDAMAHMRSADHITLLRDSNKRVCMEAVKKWVWALNDHSIEGIKSNFTLE